MIEVLPRRVAPIAVLLATAVACLRSAISSLINAFDEAQAFRRACQKNYPHTYE
jgi:hypothetical protein